MQLRIFAALKATGFMHHAFTGQEAVDVFNVSGIEDVIARRLTDKQRADLAAVGFISWHVIRQNIMRKTLPLEPADFKLHTDCEAGSPERQLICSLAYRAALMLTAFKTHPARPPVKQTREQALAASAHTPERITEAQREIDTAISARPEQENVQLAASREYIIKRGRRFAPPGMPESDILNTYGILVVIVVRRDSNTIPVYVPVFDGVKTRAEFCAYVLDFLRLNVATCSARCSLEGDNAAAAALTAQDYQRCPATLYVEW